MNRELLYDILSDSYDVITAENGLEGMAVLREQGHDLSLVLLDIMMPVMDGFETLTLMNKEKWIELVPAIMISPETSFSYIDRAYALGAIDYISRPFDEHTVLHRVASNIMMNAKQKDLTELLSPQIYQKEKDNQLMIEILSNIVEFRNGESGLHVLHVHTFTEYILKQLIKKTDKYRLSQDDIRLISNTSALHDIGKIAIPSEILNKPGRFTAEEFEIMKTHAIEGANMLEKSSLRKDKPLVKISYQICRWHHERYDGKGYPDGLKGEEIPIAAQAVALADVYDALTSERVYKKAVEPDRAVEMIVIGECGEFNPLLLECLTDIADILKKELGVISSGYVTEKSIRQTVEGVLKNNGSDISNKTIKLLESERMKSKFLADLSREIVFEYSVTPEFIKLSEFGTEILNLPEIVFNPTTSEFGMNVFEHNDFSQFLTMLNNTTPQKPYCSGKYFLNINGDRKRCKVIARTIWSDESATQFDSAIGKIVDVSEETAEISRLEEMASKDSKTGLWNYSVAKERISHWLTAAEGKHYALIFFDFDDFKKANDERGHLFGDEVLAFVTDIIKRTIRSADIAARMGGDEFIVFMEYGKLAEPPIKRLFNALNVEYKGFPIKVSMGVACTGRQTQDYDTLFKMADTAAYSVKRNGKNSYCFYDESMKSLLDHNNGE